MGRHKQEMAWRRGHWIHEVISFLACGLLVSAIVVKALQTRPLMHLRGRVFPACGPCYRSAGLNPSRLGIFTLASVSWFMLASCGTMFALYKM